MRWASRFSSGRKSGWATLIISATRSRRVLPRRWAMPCSVTTKSTKLRCTVIGVPSGWPPTMRVWRVSPTSCAAGGCRCGNRERGLAARAAENRCAVGFGRNVAREVDGHGVVDGDEAFDLHEVADVVGVGEIVELEAVV